MSNEIDELMSRIDEYCRGERGFDPKDIDAVIAYQRRYRAQLEAGGGKSVRKGKAIAKPEGKLDLGKLGLITKAPVQEIKRRI